MTPGIHINVSREQYRALPHLNQSTLKKWIELGDIPSEFKHWLDTKDEQKPSEALILGDALDCFLLCGHTEVSERYALSEKFDRRTKQGKADAARFVEENKGKIVIDPHQWSAVNQMVWTLLSNDSTKDVFRHCQKAVAIGELWGIKVKAEYDLWNPQSEHLMDLKTCRDLSPKAFARDFINFGYHYQASFYLLLANELGHEKQVFDFVCVKNEPPWTVAVYSFTPFDDNSHRLIYDQCIDELIAAAGELKWRLDTNDFADPPDWQRIRIPRYAFKRDWEEV